MPSPPTTIMHLIFESLRLSEIDTVSKCFEINGEISFTWNQDRVNFFAILIADFAAVISESLDIIANESICLVINLVQIITLRESLYILPIICDM